LAQPLPLVESFGDAAVLITLDSEATEASAARAQALARRIRESVAGGDPLDAVVPAATSVLVHIDPTRVEAAIERLEALADQLEPEDDRWPDDRPTVEIPVRYGGTDGPDLEAVADATGLSPERVIELHAGAEYRALFLGFVPGFAYLGPLPRELVLPRRATPRVRVPAGSVAIAGTQAAVYPIESPGGWHLLGRTSIPMWDPGRDPPAMLMPGGRVRFVPEQR
jgi:KipI family sensor histidine kinase inhibitor